MVDLLYQFSTIILYRDNNLGEYDREYSFEANLDVYFSMSIRFYSPNIVIQR